MKPAPDFPPSPLDYRSPDRRVSRLGRLCPGAVFYPKMISSLRLAAGEIKSGRATPRRLAAPSYLALAALEACGGKARVENAIVLRDLPGPCVLVANHMSSLETLVLPWAAGSFRPVTFVTKKSLLQLPWLGTVLGFLEAIPVERTDPRRDLVTVLEQGAERLSRGISVAVFPQAHRMERFDPAGFNSLGVKLARRAGVPAVPLAVKTDAWGVGRIFKEFGKIRPEREVLFSFGPPVDPSFPAAQAQIIAYISRTLEAQAEG